MEGGAIESILLINILIYFQVHTDCPDQVKSSSNGTKSVLMLSKHGWSNGMHVY